MIRDSVYCQNAVSDTLRATSNNGNSLLWYGTNATGGTSANTGSLPSTGTVGVQGYYVMSTEYAANKHLFNENVQKHPKLQWMMLCAASPGMGKQFHQWIPNISTKVSKLQENAKLKDIKDYYAKIYPKANPDDIKAVSEAFVDQHKKKMFLAERYPQMKFEDIELLAEMITDDDIDQYKRDSGN